MLKDGYFELQSITYEILMDKPGNKELVDSILDCCYSEAKVGNLSAVYKKPLEDAELERMWDIVSIFRLKGFITELTCTEQHFMLFVSWGVNENID